MYPVLTKRKNFLLLWRIGKHYRSRYFIIQTAPIKLVRVTTCHVGITCSSKVGGAVVRNRVKRRLRMLINKHFSLFLQSCSYVIIARPIIVNQEFHTIEKDLKRLLATVKNYVA